MDLRGYVFSATTTRPFSNWDPNPLRYVQLDAPVLEIDVAELWGHDGLKGKGKVDEGRGPPATPCPAVTACKIFLKFNENRKFSWEKKGEDTPADFQPKLDIKTFSGFICVKLPPRKRAVLFFWGGECEFLGKDCIPSQQIFLGKFKKPPRPKDRRLLLGVSFFLPLKKRQVQTHLICIYFFPRMSQIFCSRKAVTKETPDSFCFCDCFCDSSVCQLDSQILIICFRDSLIKR